MAKRRLESLPDADRCTRSGKSNWRCSLPRLPGKRFCSKHHLANLSRHHPDPPAPSPQSDLCEVWAFRRTPCARTPSSPHPYHYARINRTTPLHADVTPLLPHPSNPSPSFGLFSPIPTAPTTSTPISDFTHRVFFESSAGGCYSIYPRKGEVWRLKGSAGTIEVVASFREDAGAATAALLVEDESGVFRRRTHEGCELFRRFAREDLKAFSHRLPDARVAHTGVCMLEEEKNNASLNCQETAGRQSENHSMSSKESSMEGPRDNPTDNRENASTVEAVSNVQGTDFFQGMTSSMKGSHRQQETYSMNINVSEESVRPIENQGSVPRHTIDAIDAESVMVRETVSSQGVSACEQPVKVFGYDGIEMKRTMEQGEIWALYDESDGLPRTYARIDKFLTPEGRVEVTRLEPHPTLDTEMQWVDDNLPLACGTFRASNLTCILELSNFSHRVICDRVKATRLFYTVFPCKGEIWATYKNGDHSWAHSDLKNSPEYRLVEVLSDYSEGAGVEVADLVRVEGNEVVLQRLLSGESGLTRMLSRQEFVRFSHRVPFLKVLQKKRDARTEIA